MGKMKSGTGRERPHSKKPKKAEIEGKEQGKKKSECRKKNPIKNLRKVGSDQFSVNKTKSNIYYYSNFPHRFQIENFKK